MDNLYLKHLVEKIGLKECEYDTIKSMITHHNDIIMDSINSAFVNTNITFAELFPQQHEINENNKSDIKEYNEYYDTLYKHLALKTHPDKVDNTNDDFVIIKEACEKKDILKLFHYIEKYDLSQHNDININLLTMILEKRLYEIKEKISQIKNSFGYKILICDKNKTIDSIKGLIILYQENTKLKQEKQKLTDALDKIIKN